MKTKNEKPILFSTGMVQAILAGRKSQTRRIIKKPPVYDQESGYKFWDNLMFDIHDDVLETMYMPDHCPYGQISDILWVRETWMPLTVGFAYRADGLVNEAFPGIKWRPSIFMPKEACRIRLEITNIRVERLHNISEQDAIAEGIEPEGEGWKSYEIIHAGRHKGEPAPHSVVPNKSPVTSYMELWQSINDLESWGQNPWVWVINFKKL